MNVIEMKNKYFMGIALYMVGLLPMSAQLSTDNEDGVAKINILLSRQDYVPGQVLMKFKDSNRVQVRQAGGQFASVSLNRVSEVLQKHCVEQMEQLLPNENPNRKLARVRSYNGDIIEERDLSQLYLLKLSDAHQEETMQIVDELNAIDEVEYAEPNFYAYIMGEETIAESYSANPMAQQQWYLDAYGVRKLWNKPIINPERPVIAIIDTGVDTAHPDLKNNIVDGYDFVNDTPNVIDDNMHGTHVAGIAAACNNETGIVGANPKALIMPIKVLDKNGRGNTATVLKGVNYAVEHGAKILNLSLGGYGYSKTAADVYRNASLRAVIVAAAGNDGKCLYASHAGTLKHGIQPAPSFPGAYSFVLGVQATDRSGTLASFSNYDDDGPLFSCETSLDEPDGFNYELKAPGTEILSTLPGGIYGELQGTSMATPLVAGAISALIMVKQYDSQERLWAELLHTKNILEAYELKELPADLDVVRIMLRQRKEFSDETEEAFSGINEVNAGETISIYPVIRCTAGEATNIKLKLEFDENEDPNIVQILTGEADFGWHLDAMGKAVSKNPLTMKIPEGIADSRIIKMKIKVLCDEQDAVNSRIVTFRACNVETISGLITEDLALESGHVYYVKDNTLVNNGVTLTIAPGTRLEFASGKGLKVMGKIVAKGTPEKPIIFTSYLGNDIWSGIETHIPTNDNPIDTISWCRFEYSRMDCDWNSYAYPYMKDCLITKGSYQEAINAIPGIRNVLTENTGGETFKDRKRKPQQYWNIINNNHAIYKSGSGTLCKYSELKDFNFFNNPAIIPNWSSNGKYIGHEYWIQINSSEPEVDHADQPSYLGTSREDIVRPHVFELGNAPNATWGKIDLSNMRKAPIQEAHGIVWKVCVNGKDAQDEYEDLVPLGVGKHKFEVYFNRPMNKRIEPKISFGVRDPWTQNGVDEDGSWNEEGTIYTAYKTITGKTSSDGINRIYVRGAEDNELFPCPYEKSRFNINIQAAGSMATGFTAEASLGCVNLTWDNSNNDIEDAMGYNVYRFCREEGTDTIRINMDILGVDTSEYTDYEVIPNHTYYYLYKVLSTDLREYDVSNIVAATPLTATLGDVNGNGDVDVIDVMTTVNYIIGKKTVPFIFAAADMNADYNIDVLDVVGIVQKIMHPDGTNAASVNNIQAVYTIEDGVLYVESPVELAGVQILLNTCVDVSDVNLLYIVDSALDRFEHSSAWLSDNDYMFVAFSMSGNVLSAGKHALMKVEDSNIKKICLSDVSGHYVKAVAGKGTTNIDNIGSKVMKQSGVFNLNGQKVAASESGIKGLKRGVYIINGQKIVK